MITHIVLNGEGQENGSVELNSRVFDEKGSMALVHDTVVWQRNCRRAGTHSCLSKGIMKGGNRKPWKQKGTGRARAGSNTSPIWVGGAVAHGPHPRDYTSRVPVRTRKTALRIVISEKRKQDRLRVIDQFGFDKIFKTKEARDIFARLGILQQGAVLVLSSTELQNKNFMRAVSNLASLYTLGVAGANVYDLLRYPYLVVTKGALVELEGRLSSAEDGVE